MTTKELEDYFGNPNKAAAFFGISPEAFYQWRKRPGMLIPKGRAAEAFARTGEGLCLTHCFTKSLPPQRLNQNHRRGKPCGQQRLSNPGRYQRSHTQADHPDAWQIQRHGQAVGSANWYRKRAA